ncbi:helix-turn-helix domain-containing protein [Aureimonas mangrovi]|uniref:helix-turn-helix domain-containing protein n=1 Tax=Aureimonas mangrovi TaxID=2758041 RepID=UPI00163D5539|nr:XRE family transcriptional regulator [Aureimonas mangrovi]
MSESKIFAGPRIRRLRQGLKLTQTAMAQELAISPSYLNLIERNQRPLTVQIILKLAETYRIDLAGLKATGDSANVLAQLKAVFAEPLISDELPGDGELVEVAEAAPNAAAGIVRLHRAYKELEERLSDLSGLLAAGGRAVEAAPRLPSDEVRETFETRPNHFPALDRAAETLHESLAAGDDPAGALRRWLRERHDIAVRVLPADTMPSWRRRFDRHSRRLFLSERLPQAERLHEMAAEAMALEAREAVDAEIATFAFTTPEASRLARTELLAYAADALTMPYASFQSAALRLRYDAGLLAQRFQVSFLRAAFRLTSLQRAAAPGLPFFAMEVDQAGNRIRRAGARGFPHQRFGGACVKLPVHEVFAMPERVLAEAAQTPDGTAYLLVARSCAGLAAGIGERPRRTAVLLGLDLAQAGETVYAAMLPQGVAPVPIGPACRLCERAACPARAEPPLTRPLALDPHVAGLSPYDFH